MARKTLSIWFFLALDKAMPCIKNSNK